MQQLKKNDKGPLIASRLVMGTVLILMIISPNLGCGSKAPKPPVVDLYVSDIKVSESGCRRTDGGVCKPSETNVLKNATCVSPTDWERIQNRDDELVCQIDTGVPCTDSLGQVNMARFEGLPLGLDDDSEHRLSRMERRSLRNYLTKLRDARKHAITQKRAKQRHR